MKIEGRWNIRLSSCLTPMQLNEVLRSPKKEPAPRNRLNLCG